MFEEQKLFTAGLGGYFRNPKHRAIFANPASRKRENLTIRQSYDECRRWPVSRVLHAGSAQVSDLCATDDLTILCFRERGEREANETLTLVRFDLARLQAAKE